MIRPFARNWTVGTRARYGSTIWIFSNGWCKLVRALETAVEHGDVTRREAGYLLDEVEWEMIRENVQRQQAS